MWKLHIHNFYVLPIIFLCLLCSISKLPNDGITNISRVGVIFNFRTVCDTSNPVDQSFAFMFLFLRSEMRLKDRHVREMEERFCFLVTSDQKAKQMYQHGLKVENSDQHSLGNPSYGVYLHRHADVALKNISGNTPAGKILIIFKVRW